MRPNLKTSLRTLLAAAALLLATLPAHAQSSSTVEIKSVDNYGGNSNVTTNAPNSTVKVTELDADKKPVRSWTGTTDSDGRITIPAGSNLSKEYLRATLADPKSAEFVLPPSLGSNEPFFFSAVGSLQGEVIDIQTVQGEVVSSPKADRHGRVYLAAGLAAGAYIVSSTKDRDTKLTRINVDPNPVNPGSALSLDEEYVALAATKFGAIDGKFPNPTFLDFDDFISTRTPMLLAASTRQVVLSSPNDAGLALGPHRLTLADRLTGQTVSANVLVYDVSARLAQTSVLSGMQTQLVLTVQPKELSGTAGATIKSGPVRFADGTSQASAVVEGGTATFPIQAQSGTAGQFDVDWWFKPGDHHKQPLRARWWEPWKYKWHLWKPANDGKRGGDTKALKDGWKPIKVVDKDGKVIGEGSEKTVTEGDTTTTRRIVTEGAKKTVDETVSEDGKTRSTDRTTTTMPDLDGVTVEVEETIVEKKDEKGEWRVESHTKTTKKIKGGKIIDEKTDVLKKPK